MLGGFGVTIGANVKGLVKGLNTAKTELNKFASTTTAIGKDLTMKLTLPIVGIATAAVKTAADFEQSMNKLGAISEATGKTFEDLENKAKELGSTTKFTASEAADGMTFLAMAGFKANEVISAIPGALKLAAAGNMDLATSADIASNILTGFALSAEESDRVVDVLAKTMTSSNTNLTQLGEAMKFVAPVAKGFGVSVEETSAAIGMLSDAGIQSSMAGTTLRNIMVTMKEASEELGFSMTDAQGKMLPLADLLDLLAKKSGGTQQAIDIFGKRAGPGLVSLLEQGASKLKDFTKELENSGGTAARIADKQMQGFNGAITELKSAVQGLFIEMMETGALKQLEKAIDSVTSFIRNMSEMTDESKEKIILLMGAVALLPPIIVGLGVTISALGVVMGALTSPITLTIAAIAGLAAIIAYTVVNFDALKARFTNIDWWRNALIDMVQFYLEYNPTKLIIDGFNKLLSFFGKLEIPNPFEGISKKLEGFKKDLDPNTFPKLKSFSESMGESFTTLKDKMAGFVFGAKKVPKVLEQVNASGEMASKGFKIFENDLSKMTATAENSVPIIWTLSDSLSVLRGALAEPFVSNLSSVINDGLDAFTSALFNANEFNTAELELRKLSLEQQEQELKESLKNQLISREEYNLRLKVLAEQQAKVDTQLNNGRKNGLQSALDAMVRATKSAVKRMIAEMLKLTIIEGFLSLLTGGTGQLAKGAGLFKKVTFKALKGATGTASEINNQPIIPEIFTPNESQTFIPKGQINNSTNIANSFEEALQKYTSKLNPNEFYTLSQRGSLNF